MESGSENEPTIKGQASGMCLNYYLLDFHPLLKPVENWNRLYCIKKSTNSKETWKYTRGVWVFKCENTYCKKK